jgi:hypothetical protein
MKAFAISLLVSFLMMTAACSLLPHRESELQRQSRERYRARYRHSGGFDPVSKSLGQRMR